MASTSPKATSLLVRDRAAEGIAGRQTADLRGAGPQPQDFMFDELETAGDGASENRKTPERN